MPASPTLLSGPVSVCIDRPLLSLDRPFTYRLPDELHAGIGSLVSVRFHGRLVRGWILGPTDDVPPRMLDIQKVHGDLRVFDEGSLPLLHWVAERYIAPLSSVISRSVPPRVVSEEKEAPEDVPSSRKVGPSPAVGGPSVLGAYRNGPSLLAAIRSGSGPFVVRPGPADEVASAVEATLACVEGGRRAIVLVPEATPLPATAAAVEHIFGSRCALFLGGNKRSRYRMWLDVQVGGYDVVIGTRPAIFAPLDQLGLIWISRESHAASREDRSPYYHVRDVAIERAKRSGAVVVMSALCPSAEAVSTGAPEVAPVGRSWPPVEVVKPGVEGRAPRLVGALKRTRGAFLFEPLRGYGMAQVCKTCGEPATCAVCGGALRSEAGAITCIVCEAEGRCASCGGTTFGVQRGGAERVAEWVKGLTELPVRAGPPKPGAVSVGGAEAVHDLGPLDLDLVGVLDADLVLRRPGVGSVERGLAVWMESAAWASRGTVVVQTTRANDAAIQALVAGNPARFYRAELPRRAEAGFPAGAPVFRIGGTDGLEAALSELEPLTLLVSGHGTETVCLVTLRPEQLRAFGERIRELARAGTVSRVEAEPHLS